MRCVHPCRISNPSSVPILSYLVNLGIPIKQAQTIIIEWEDEVRLDGPQLIYVDGI